MTAFLVLLTLLACRAALGRVVIPRAERLPWWTWTWQDLATNIARGARVLSDANDGQQRLWELHHRQLHARQPEPPDKPPPDSRSRAP